MALYHHLSIPCVECGRSSGMLHDSDNNNKNHITDTVYCDNCSLAAIIEEEPETLRMSAPYPFPFMEGKQSACGYTMRIGFDPQLKMLYRKIA